MSVDESKRHKRQIRKIRIAGFNRCLLKNAVPILILLCLSVPQSVCYIANIGPWSIPDHDMHVSSTYALATGQIFPEMTVSTDKFGNDIHRPIISGDSRYLRNDGAHNDLVSNIIKTPFEDSSISQQKLVSESATNIITDTPRATQYTPFAYIPQAIGLKVGLSFGLSPYASMQIARLSNYFICLALFVASVVLLPRAKMIMVVIASIPAVCFVSSSLMLDGFMIALASIITSFALQAADSGRTMTRGTFIAVLISAVLLCYIKVIYLVPLLLVFVLPNRVLSLKRKISMGLTLGLVFISYLLWSRRFGSVGYLADYSANVSYVVRHPLHFIICIIVNIAIGWKDLIPLDSATILVIALLIVMSIGPLMKEDSQHEHSCPESAASFLSYYRYVIVSAVGALFAWAIVYAFDALTWNDLPSLGAYGYLEGVQGRYILPLLPLLAVSGFYGYSRKDRQENRQSDIGVDEEISAAE